MPTEDLKGTWMRGPDGSLYFIPDSDLAAFRVPEDQAAKTLKQIDEGRDVEVGPPSRDIPKITTLAAIRGPLAKRDLGAGPNAIVPPAAQLRGLRQKE
jgi:hypothetical protein